MFLLRISASWKAAALLVSVTVVAVLHRDPLWLGEWNWTTDWFNSATILMGPIVGGCAAFDAGALVSRRRSRALFSLRRGETMPVLIVATNGLVGAGIQVLALLVGFALNLAVGAGGTPSLRSIPVSLAVYFGCAGLGLVAGHLLGNPFAPPVAAVALFVLSALGDRGGNPFAVFVTGGVTGSLVGYTWAPGNLLLYLATLLALAVFSVALVTYLVSPLRTLARTVLVSASAATLVVVSGAVTVSTADRFVVDHSAVDYACAGTAPHVCLDVRTSRPLDSLATRMAELAVSLVGVGASPPETFSQVVPGHQLPPSAAPIFLDPYDFDGAQTPARTAASYLTVPAACPQLTGEQAPPPAYFDARRLLEQWLLLRVGELPSDEQSHSVAPGWLRADPAEQATWVVDTYAALRSCELSRVAVPR